MGQSLEPSQRRPRHDGRAPGPAAAPCRRRIRRGRCRASRRPRRDHGRSRGHDDRVSSIAGRSRPRHGLRAAAARVERIHRARRPGAHRDHPSADRDVANRRAARAVGQRRRSAASRRRVQAVRGAGRQRGEGSAASANGGHEAHPYAEGPGKRPHPVDPLRGGRHRSGRRPPHRDLAGRRQGGTLMAGLWYEEFKDGKVFNHEWSRTITETDNVWFSLLTMNVQPLHIDAHYAAKSEWGKPLVNSLFTLGLLIGMSVNDTTFGTTLANLGMKEVNFPKPLFQGDSVKARTTVLSKRESKSRPNEGIVNFFHEMTNQNGEVVATCERAALMRKRPAGTA